MAKTNIFSTKTTRGDKCQNIYIVVVTHLINTIEQKWLLMQLKDYSKLSGSSVAIKFGVK